MNAVPAVAVDHLPLPAHAHLPGVNARPADDFLAAAGVVIPARTVAAEAADNIGWRYGIRLFNAGYFWEAHDVLEGVWMNAAPNSRERHLVAAVIQLANGWLKQAMGRDRAASRLAGLALDHVERAYAGHVGRLMGLDRAALAEATFRLRATSESAPAVLSPVFE